MYHLLTVFAGLSSQAILKGEGKLETKFKILDCEFGDNLDVYRVLMEVLRVRYFLETDSKMEYDMTMMTYRMAEIYLSM